MRSTSGSAANHPLHAANWIWPQAPYQVLHNIYADFRRMFQLDALPTAALFHITADAQYVLWVNGQYVNRGPARGTQGAWPFDTYDLADVLQVGKNVIEVKVHSPGRGTFQYLHRDAAGLLCALELPTEIILSDTSWQTRLDATHNRLTPLLSVQQSFQEHVDLTDNPPPDRVGGDAADYQWHPPRLLYRFGHEPWSALSERGLPPLTRDIISYTARPGANGLAFDLGRTRVGTVRLEVDAPNTCDIELIFVQAVDDNDAPIIPSPTDHSCINLAARLRVGPGRTTWEAFHPIGHRYLFIRTTGSPRVTPTLRETIYPLQTVGDLSTNDAVVDAIWQMCRETQRVCLMDAYVDTPWREQAQWWGDARVQAQNTFHLADDARLLVRGIRQIGEQQLPNGLTYGHAPTIAHTCILPDFSLIWLMTFWDHWWQTGDTALLLEQWPRVQKVLRYFRNEARGSNGLLRHDPRYWLFLDWCDLHKTGTPTLLNLWHIWMLGCLADICTAAQRNDDAYVLRAERAEQIEHLNTLLWDPEQSLYRDGLDEHGTAVQRFSIHNQVLALLADLEHGPAVRRRIADYLAGELHGGADPSSYWATYVYDAAERFGMEHAMLDHIAKHWAPMLKFGGCFESFKSAQRLDVESVSHAWAAHPLFHLMRCLGGVRQTAAGWSRITFKPITDWSPVARCNAVFPTPLGTIDVRWQRGEAIHLRLPLDITADIELHGEQFTITGGVHEWPLR